MKKSTKGPLPKKLTAPKQPISKRDTVNLAKALTSPKALAAQRIAAAVRPRPMGLKTDGASNMVKALTSPKAKAMQDSTLKANVAKTGRMPMGLKTQEAPKFKNTLVRIDRFVPYAKTKKTTPGVKITAKKDTAQSKPVIPSKIKKALPGVTITATRNTTPGKLRAPVNGSNPSKVNSTAQKLKAQFETGFNRKKMAPSVKADTTQRIKVGGVSNPSVIIKKQTTVKPAKPAKKLMPYRIEKLKNKY